MPPEPPPQVILFDVNETLLDLRAVEPLLSRVLGGAVGLREWFATVLLHAQSLTLAGRYAPLGEVAGATLRMLAAGHGRTASEADLVELRERLLAMPAHPDALPGLRRLREAGFRLATLSNSAPSPPPTPLERAGLAPLFERSLSVEAVHRFKPAPETYALAARELGVAPAAVCLVAAHGWDTLGAQAAGMRAVMVERPGQRALPLPGLPPPDLVAPDVAGAAEAIIGRWGG